MFPGPYDQGQGRDLFRHFLAPKLNKLLEHRNLSAEVKGQVYLAGLDQERLKEVMSKTTLFMKTIKTLFGNELYGGEFLEERPGKFLSICTHIY